MLALLVFLSLLLLRAIAHTLEELLIAAAWFLGAAAVLLIVGTGIRLYLNTRHDRVKTLDEILGTQRREIDAPPLELMPPREGNLIEQAMMYHGPHWDARDSGELIPEFVLHDRAHCKGRCTRHAS